MKFTFIAALLFVNLVSFASFSPNLTATFDASVKAIKINWQRDDASCVFILQRSTDNTSWSDLYAVQPDAFHLSNSENYIDRDPGPDRNYYRVKMSAGKYAEEFSSPEVVTVEPSASSWTMYPVPVSNILHLRYTGQEPIKGVICVFVQNAQGKVLARCRNSSLNTNIQIPVSNLGRGVYDVRIVIMNKVVWNQRFLK